jgi:hypothetical protein
MSAATTSNEDLPAEIGRLRGRLDEAEATLAAIRNGEVDALVVAGPQGDQIFTLSGADRSYRILVEEIHQRYTRGPRPWTETVSVIPAIIQAALRFGFLRDRL